MEGVCLPRMIQPLRGWLIVCVRVPGVARSSQPRAEGFNPFGIAAVASQPLGIGGVGTSGPFGIGGVLASQSAELVFEDPFPGSRRVGLVAAGFEPLGVVDAGGDRDLNTVVQRRLFPTMGF